tara:strand:- start:2057 stop:2884 length:828 start_codon:yes stop_codon:yes gene_type:complete
MEIGLKTIQKTTKIDSHSNNKLLVIHINENWITFCLFVNEELSELNKINFLYKKKENFVLKTIKKYLKSISNNDLPKEVKLIYYNKTSTLVPSALFDDKNLLNYLKFNTTIKVNDIAANDDILNNEINNIYIPNTDINNFIFEKFKAFDFYHYSSLIIEKFSKDLADGFNDKIILNINDGFIDILFFQNKKLIFYNSFDYVSNEDILYFLLFCISELKLSPDKVHTICYGFISLESKLYELIYKYVRNVELIEGDEIQGIDSAILKSNILLTKFR